MFWSCPVTHKTCLNGNNGGFEVDLARVMSADVVADSFSTSVR